MFVINRSFKLGCAALFAFSLGLGGCSKSSDSSGAATASPGVTASDAGAASPVASAPGDAASSAAAESPGAGVSPDAAAPAAVASSGVSLSDIAGVNGEKEITELAQLGVVDPVTGTFAPGAGLKRRDFIRWLVKANNVIWSDVPGKRVKLADKTETSAFPDVASTDPDFPYVQGMQDAGYSVGFPDKTFKPDASITREQLFAIKNVFDRGGIDAGLAKDINFARNTVMPPWKDKAQISVTFVPAIASFGHGGLDNFGLVYGTAQDFRPQTAVTRAEGAVAVTVIGDHTPYSSTRDVSKAPALQSPAPH